MLKTFVLRTVACSVLASRLERVAYQDLASVCRAWRLIATRRVWFAATLRRLLATGEQLIEWSISSSRVDAHGVSLREEFL